MAARPSQEQVTFTPRVRQFDRRVQVPSFVIHVLSLFTVFGYTPDSMLVCTEDFVVEVGSVVYIFREVVAMEIYRGVPRNVFGFILFQSALNHIHGSGFYDIYFFKRKDLF